MKRWACGMGMALAAAFAVLCAPHAWAADEEPMEELKFDLPEPFFGGTPFDYGAENFETEDFKDRPPFLAPKGTAVISRGKPVTSSSAPLSGDLKMVTDGDKRYDEGSLVTLGPGVQWVQVDLGAPHELYAILLWHFHKGKTVYFSVVVQACNTPDFKEDVTFLYNSDLENHAGFGSGQDYRYVENNKGRLFEPKGHKARYLRFYSNGNVLNENNHYVEIEVWGRPMKKTGEGEGAEPGAENEETLEELKFELPEPFFGGLPL